MSAFKIFCTFGRREGYKNHAGTCSVVFSTKSKYISHKLKFIYQIRGFYGKNGPQFKEIVVIRLTENVKIVGRTNGIH